MSGMLELGEEIFHMPVRVGLPNYRGGLSEVVRNPRFATGMGLLISGFEQHQKAQVSRANIGSLTQLVDRMKNWFKSAF